jgi:hypothetical protein
MPVIPTLQRLGQEESEFEANLSYIRKTLSQEKQGLGVQISGRTLT